MRTLGGRVREGPEPGYPPTVSGAPARIPASVDIHRLLPAGGALAPVLAAPAAAILVWWAAAQGGYPPTTWYPGALAILALAVAAVLGPRAPPLPRAALVALACMAAYTAWSFLSVLWAGSRGDAWTGANRTLVYLTILALFAVLPWRATSAAAFVGAVCIAIAGLGVVALVRAGAGTPGAALDEGRLTAPTSYANGSAALYLTAFWPALVLACARAAPVPARIALLATAGVLAHLVVLTQSRGAAAGALAGVVAVAIVAPERGRVLAGGLAVAVTTIVSLPALLAVFGAADPQGAVRTELVALVLSAAALGAAARAESRLDRAPPRTRARLRHGRRATAALVAGAVAASAALSAGGSRLSEGVSSGRFDLWRVASDQLADHPLGGAGADNFAHDNARLRHGHEEPLYPHGIVFRVLGQTGIVGGVLFAGFAGSAFAAAAAAAREPRSPGAATQLGPAVAVAGAAAYASWLGHATVDWLWELPATAGLATAGLGIAMAMGRGETPAGRRNSGAVAAVAVLGLAAAASYVFPGLAARRIESAVGAAARDPALAARRLESARRLDPLSARADLIAGVLAARSGDARAARAAFARAVARDPGDWYSHARLGLLEARAGHRAVALAELHRAGALDPREPAVAAILAAVARGASPPDWVAARLEDDAVPGPLGRHAVDCRPVLGIAARCREGQP